MFSEPNSRRDFRESGHRPSTTPGNNFREHGARVGGPHPTPAGARPTPLPAEYAEILTDYTAVLADVPLSDHTRRTYVSRVRMYLAWLASGPTGAQSHRRLGGAPLTAPRSRDWAVRGYRLYLLREADPKRSVRYVNNALAALDDFHVHLGMGKATVGRDDTPRTAPKAMDARAQIRWLRAIEAWPHRRDRAPALLPFYAGLRIGDAVALDTDDVRMSAREGLLAVYGKGGKLRQFGDRVGVGVHGAQCPHGGGRCGCRWMLDTGCGVDESGRWAKARVA